jgi:hypothetical protein
MLAERKGYDSGAEYEYLASALGESCCEFRS